MQNVGSPFVDGFMSGVKTFLPCIDAERYRPSPKALVALIAVITAVAMATIGPEAVLGIYAVWLGAAFVLAIGERMCKNIRSHAASKTPEAQVKAFGEQLAALLEKVSDRAEAMQTAERFFEQELPRLMRERRDRISFEPTVRDGKLIFVVNP